MSLINPEEAEALVAAQLQAARVFFMGRVRTGLVLELFAMRLTQLGRQAHIVGSPTTPSVQPDDIYLVVSARGKTESVCLAAEKAGLVGAKIVVISSRTGGGNSVNTMMCAYIFLDQTNFPMIHSTTACRSPRSLYKSYSSCWIVSSQRWQNSSRSQLKRRLHDTPILDSCYG